MITCKKCLEKSNGFCTGSVCKQYPKEEGITVNAPDTTNDTTNGHYKNCFKDCNDVDDYCSANNTHFFIGNILKAAVRLDKKYNGKDAIKDLDKIIHYANQEKERRKSAL